MAHRLFESRSLPSSAAQTNQAFEVQCGCGKFLTGTRQPKSQTLDCPNCGAPVFVLPVDRYAPSSPRRSRPKDTPAESLVPRGMIAKLNRLAFWTRIRERRTKVAGRLSSAARHTRQWFKRRLSSLRLW